jgi:hypothetical protein
MASPTTNPVPRKAIIFGAGVTGLSVAHELAQRGFRVLVVERDVDDRDPSQPALGGMARSQFNRADATPFRRWATLDANPPTQMLDVQDLWHKNGLAEQIENMRLEYNDAELTPTSASPTTVTQFVAELKKFYHAHPNAPDPGSELRIFIWSRSRSGERLHPSATIPEEHYARLHGESSAIAKRRAEDLLADLTPMVTGENAYRVSQGWQPIQLTVLDPTVDPTDSGPATDFVGTRRGCVGLLFDDLQLPGEHGYRLFPRFYRNLLDIMKRTPIMDEVRAGAMERVLTRGLPPTDPLLGGASPLSTKKEGLHTVFDMLRSVEQHAFAPDGSGGGSGPPPRLMLRTKPKSMEDILEAIRAQHEDLGWRSADSARYTVKVLQYMTSCKARRAEYGKMPWWDYLEAHLGSPGFQQSLIHWPKALVGLDSKLADARSFGSVSTQIMLDHTRPDGYRDGTLRGPTTEVWFDHWRTYLEDLGVQFVQGTLKKLRADNWVDSNGAHNPVETVAWDIQSVGFKLVTQAGSDWNTAFPDFAVEAHDPSGAVIPDWYQCDSFLVCAVPLLETIDLCTDLVTHASSGLQLALNQVPDPWDPSGTPIKSDIKRLADWKDMTDPRNGGNLKRPPPAGPASSLRHFPGVQFYFNDNYALVPGHTYYPNSDWGLSTISQTQFRAQRPGTREGYVGIMSVVIGDPDDQFFTLTRREVAERVLKDIRAGLEYGHNTLSDPIAFHVDSNIVYKSNATQFKHNRTPYLTAKFGEWEGRPGRLDDVELWERSQAAAANNTHPGYDVYFARLVFAGNHMKTFTRLSTMESANESARHAVNGILALYAKGGMTLSHDDLSAGRWVRVFDLEDDEIDDFLFLKQLDAELFALGRPHFVKILGLDTAAASIFPGTGPNPIGTLLSTLTGGAVTNLANLINILFP